MNAPDPDGGAALDADSLLAIHRHDDGHIAICRKLPGKGLEQLWMLTPADLRGTFAAFGEWLLVNSYASTQAYWRTAPQGWIHAPTGLPAIGVDRHRPIGKRRFGRVTENLRWLNMLSCDIDCGRSETDAKTDLERVPWRDAQRRLEDLQDAGLVPPISMYGYSGRGLYAIWLLHDEHNRDHSAPAYDHHVVTWKALQKELIRRVESAPLPVDHAGSLITQVYKIGGSLHPATGERARFFITAQADKHRRLISYTLPELAAAFGMQALSGDLPDQTREQAHPARTRRAPLSRNPLRSHGYKARHAQIASDMLSILAHRLADGSGGWRKRGEAYADGHRSPVYGRWMILSLYARALVRSMYSPKELRPPATIDPDTRQDVLSRLRDMAAHCQQPYPDDSRDTPESILNAVLSEYKLVRSPRTGELVQILPPTPSTKTLCAAFGVDADLARELDLKTIRPRDVALDADRERPTAQERVAVRQQFLRDWILAHPNPSGGGRWTARKVRDALTPFAPYPWNNHETANQDLNAIGYRMDRSRGGRRRKNPER